MRILNGAHQLVSGTEGEGFLMSGMETRYQDLRKELVALVIESEQRQETRLQEVMMEMKALITGLCHQNDDLWGSRSQRNHGVRNLEERRESSGAGSMIPWSGSMKLEFPRFNGEGLEDWLLRAEYYFKVEGISLENLVKVVALPVEERAIQWHQGFVKAKGVEAYEDWEGYVKALNARFGTHAYDDPLAELRNLKQ